MVRSYLRHEPTSAFGVICSSSANALLDPDGKTAVVPALEDVLVWDVKRGALVSSWHEVGHRSRVTALARSPANPDTFAVGYQDGSIRLWSAQSGTTNVTLNGHKAAVTHLAFDHNGLRLASAGQDTNVILWDIVAESGLYRLRGHRDTVTCVAFVYTPSTSTEQASSSSSPTSNPVPATNAPGYLLSASKDGLLKLWDLGLQHCVQTVVPGQGEIASIAVSQQIPLSLDSNTTDTAADDQDTATLASHDGGALVLTGSSEGELRVWEITANSLINGLQSESQPDPNIAANDSAAAAATTHKFIIPRGNVPVSGNHRVSQIDFCGSASQRYIAVSSTDKAVQIFRLRSTEEIAKKMARRRRRMKEKAEKKGKKAAAEPHETENDTVTWADRIESYTTVRPSVGRLRSFSALVPEGQGKGGLSLLTALSTNALEIHTIPPPPRSKAEKSERTEPSLACALDLPGHRADVRAIALSSDDTLLASACGAGQLKIWNVTTGRCIRTLPCGYALCLVWLEGDQHVLVGCKDGTLRSFDIRAGVAIETVQAHEGPLWSIAVQPESAGCVTASADKDVKFWEFEMVVPSDDESEDDDDDDDDDDEPKAPKAGRAAQLSLVHVRTLKMTDDVLCARFSPNGKLLALSLLDNTVKVFFADTLKFFLSLYGHKLPVLALDISGDSKLCVTVSADKNVKIWGLDFGDCHKSIFAHDESIMGVCFERGQQGGGLFGGREGESHHFWTVGKDGLLKHWDGDRFELIQQLEGHHGEIWALAPGHRGQVVVTAGADRSIRTWEKTEEPLFLEEERERELERAYESAGPTAAEPQGQGEGEGEGGAEAVSKATRETMVAGERLMEAIDLTDAGDASHPVVASAFKDSEEADIYRFLLRAIEAIPASQLEDALLVLPFDRVIALLRHLDHFARKEWNITLVSRILFFLLRTHNAQIVSNRVMRPVLVNLRSHLRTALSRQKVRLPPFSHVRMRGNTNTRLGLTDYDRIQPRCSALRALAARGSQDK